MKYFWWGCRGNLTLIIPRLKKYVLPTFCRETYKRCSGNLEVRSFFASRYWELDGRSWFVFVKSRAICWIRNQEDEFRYWISLIGLWRTGPRGITRVQLDQVTPVCSIFLYFTTGACSMPRTCIAFRDNSGTSSSSPTGFPDWLCRHLLAQ